VKSWLRDGEEVTARFVETGTVTTVWGGDELLLDAQVGLAEERSFSGSWLAPDDWELVKRGARFWLVQERAVARGSGREVWSAIRFARPGVECARVAFGVPDGEP